MPRKPRRNGCTSAVRLCPENLEICGRNACAAGVCEKTREFALIPCLYCGVPVHSPRIMVCIDCVDVEINPAEQA